MELPSNNSRLTSGALSSSNTTATAFTPSCSIAGSTRTYIGSSSNGRGTSNTTDVPGRPLPRPAYIMQPATNDATLYGRFVTTGQPHQPVVCPYSRISYYTVRAQQKIDQFEAAFEPGRGGQ